MKSFIKNIPYSKEVYTWIRDQTRLASIYSRYLYDKKRFHYQLAEWKFDHEYGSRAVVSGYPKGITLYLTFKCNFRCEGCTYLLNDADAFDDGDYITWNNFESIARRYAGKIKFMMFTGGEATLHPDFVKMAKLAHELGYTLNMATNGSNLLKIKEALPLFYKINVSMDSYDFETFHKNRCASEKVYEKIIEGLEWMRDNDVPFRLSYVLSHARLSEAFKFIEFAKKYRPYQLLFHSLIPHKEESDDTLKMKNRDVQDFFRKMTQLKDIPSDVILPFTIPADEEQFKSAICPKMWSSVYISDNGDIAYCCQLQADSTIGNIFNGYDFNSEKMVSFRKSMINGDYPAKDCALCQQRFEMLSARTQYIVSENRWINIPAELAE